MNWKEKESPLQGACRELAEELFAQDETRIDRVSVSLLRLVLIVVGSGAFLLGGSRGPWVNKVRSNYVLLSSFIR